MCRTVCRKLSEVMENQRKASRWQLPDFMRRLEAKVDVRELTCNEFPKPMLHMVCKNAMNSVRNSSKRKSCGLYISKETAAAMDGYYCEGRTGQDTV